jgi:hypothetical protein
MILQRLSMERAAADLPDGAPVTVSPRYRRARATLGATHTR